MNIDIKLITDNLVELLTNTINMSSLFKDIFDSKADPATLKTTQYIVEDNKVVPTTVLVDNMSKIKSDLQSGVVLPDESQTLINKTINADNNTISNLSVTNFKDDVISSIVHDTAQASDTVLPTEKSVATALSEVLSTILLEVLDGKKIRVITQGEYDDITEKDPDTLYFIKES